MVSDIYVCVCELNNVYIYILLNVYIFILLNSFFFLRGWKMAQGLRLSPVYQQDSSLVPNTHFQKLTNNCKAGSRDSATLLSSLNTFTHNWPPFTWMYTHTWIKMIVIITNLVFHIGILVIPILFGKEQCLFLIKIFTY